MKLRFSWVIVVLAVSVTPALATTITIGTSGVANAFPFGCGPTCGPTYLGEYQEIYSLAAFSGPMTINQIAFETVASGAPHSLTDVFTLGLGTTSATPAAPGISYAANKRADFTTVFSGTVNVASTGSGAFDFIINLT